MLNQDKKVNLEIRKSRPQTLASAFGGVMEMFGGRVGDADLLNNYNLVKKFCKSRKNLLAIQLHLCYIMHVSNCGMFWRTVKDTIKAN